MSTPTTPPQPDPTGVRAARAAVPGRQREPIVSIEVDGRAWWLVQDPVLILPALGTGLIGPTRIDESFGHTDVHAQLLCDEIARTPGDDVVDLCELFVDELPIRTICHLLAIPDEPAALLRASATAASDPGLTPEQAEAHLDRIRQILRDTCTGPRVPPGDDLADDLISAHTAGELGEPELAALAFVLAAGLAATADLLEHTITAVLRDPVARAQALYGARTWAQLVGEAARGARSGVVGLPWRAVTDTVVGGVRIAAGELVLVALDAPEPHHDPAHGNSPVAAGAHRCRSRDLAVRHTVVAVSALAQRFPDMTVAGADELTDRRGDLAQRQRVLPVRPGRMRSSTLSAAITDGPTTIFLFERYRRPPVEVRAVATDLYRGSVCSACRSRLPARPVTADREQLTTVVHRVTDPDLPWYVTVEVHRCHCGAAVRLTHATSVTVRPVDGHACARQGEYPDQTIRAFAIDAVDGSRHTVVEALELDSGHDCDTCTRNHCTVVYRILTDRLPTWMDTLPLQWCARCHATGLPADRCLDHGVTAAPTKRGPKG